MMTMTEHGPAFQEPSAPEPGAVELEVPQHLLGRMKQAFRDNGIPDTQENRERFLEAEDIREALEEFGIHPQRVAATADGEGHVRLVFDDIRKLMELIEPGSAGGSY
jgi:hypothetical protein